ncbi:septum site-determining protein MinC [Acidocella sp.]|jgi:septum site-determining protein MinC|uniref:septum site-determining protein MinC n=1 Tax=Acidocella sp. TaxID=50710 RepID=UPI002F417BC6
MALIVAPEAPLEPWLAALDEQMLRSAGFFVDRPIIVNLAAIDDGSQNLGEVLDALASRDLRIVGLEGIDPVRLSGTGWERLPKLQQGREMRAQATTDREIVVPGASEPEEAAEAVAEKPVEAAVAEEPPARLPSLLIDRPVRSGQSVVFEDGDIIVVGSVSSGAELIAGGSIHVYGSLRGRAIAGIRTGGAARIFCQKLMAELIAIDGIYDMAEHWGDKRHGRAVQIQLDTDSLKISPLE